ncbi:hypothetical protein LEMA_P081310.1 [Plenodomus lingam JN3]|uniref:WSC domain-containing protein n=1 Tax=Leptosphaeria maculans (strain JN3 / isolate v23.1.3 / race Av1-4-5-6-7-8) TaxID=985895 RepID=E5A5J4_LEPMJ|nr:hypothetical protein LEMA_P081310.1 [Plenodomus lingam JN3]CBX98892.1 hypothetical protein LEMA_P081310.1 [Plenodomus lingam JN3]
MLAGDPSKSSFACPGTNTAEINNLPPYNCPNGLRAQVFFPSCWNVKDLDTPDHISHMSYPLSETYNSVLYDTSRFQDEWFDEHHPFVFANGDPTSYGFHGDFINGWDVAVLQNAIDTCPDNSGAVENCRAVTMFTPEQCNACKIPTTVREETAGMLDKLPGRNPVTPGPDPAPYLPCSDDTVALGHWTTNFIDLTAEGWAYLGCGTDDVANRALPAPNAWTYNPNMTVESCITHCTASSSSKSFTYAALENGNECFCGPGLSGNHAPQNGHHGFVHNEVYWWSKPDLWCGGSDECVSEV